MSLIGHKEGDWDGDSAVSDAGDNEERFTRATWRAGKRRVMQKRTKAWGGRKSAPKAFLEAAKRVQFGSGVHKICTATKRDGAPCGNIALSGMTICGPHGGFSQWAKQGKLRQSGKKAAAKAREQAAMVEGRAQAAPRELVRMQIYQQANQWDRIRMIKAWGSTAFPRLAKQTKYRGTSLYG